MKKLVALLLALAALAASFSALAEENASIVRVSDISLSYVGESGARSMRFEDASLTAALGLSEGAPTLQLMFENGAGQAVDAVAQLVDRDVLLAMGGISATYSVSLDRFASPGNSGADIARGLSKVLSLAISHLDVLLYAVTREGEDGMRSLTMPLPMPQLIAAAEAMLSAGVSDEAGQDSALSELMDRVESLEGEAQLGFRYDPATGLFALAAVQGGAGMRLSGTMSITFEPRTFIDITPEGVEVWDLFNLTEAQQEELQGELGILLPKLLDYAGTGVAEAAPLD